MATPIKRIEKDFLLKALYDEQLPVLFFRNRVEYTLTVEKPTRDLIYFKSDRPITGLQPQNKMELKFDYRGKVISFTVEAASIRVDRITTTVPEFLYKNLDRSFSRVPSPPDLQFQFTFLGDSYSLGYPKIQDYEEEEVAQLMSAMDTKNLTGLIAQIAAWIKTVASDYKLHLFRDLKPANMEERLLSETGKSLFLPSSLEEPPQGDPYPQKRLITAAMFRRHLESSGIAPERLDAVVTRYIQMKAENGISSELWIPIRFQEYVIGYIHLWINKGEKPPFTYEVIDTLYQFAKVFVFSLKENGYFEANRVRNSPLDGRMIDISVSGTLFTYPHSNFASSLVLNSELAVKLSAPKRVITTGAQIVRRYVDRKLNYFGCRFLDMAPEDLRFLFEYIYGKPFTDADAVFLSGRV
jgi:hypothetical protein